MFLLYYYYYIFQYAFQSDGDHGIPTCITLICLDEEQVFIGRHVDPAPSFLRGNTLLLGNKGIKMLV